MLLVLVPSYLSRRSKDLVLVQDALLAGDFEAIRTIGHKLRGHAGTYGFDQLSIIGMDIESAAKLEDAVAVQRLMQLLKDYLEHVEIAPPSSERLSS